MVSFKIAAFHSVMFVLHALDLLATSTIDPSREINPVASALWLQHGFWTLIVIKGLVWGLMLACHLVVRKWLSDLTWVVWISQSIGLGAMACLVIWNFSVI